eukprot:gnl/TRDRNA2_/TRDRNA2_176417_c6_seq5.p1 gnl/TRDRNA2_/TRDRNA2_176417_c6~~gnl/TRDRNA2_/TRDRNA2_176417_c6_seq5.p1  ORF type:complete len:302 (-),score=33.33 gnl/TRDRNA2_/TRDRNA2_176417_c6_seq5:112-1017(-)
MPDDSFALSEPLFHVVLPYSAQCCESHIVMRSVLLSLGCLILLGWVPYILEERLQNMRAFQPVMTTSHVLYRPLTYTKALHRFAHVLGMAGDDTAAIYKAVEEFGLSGNWTKVACGNQSEVLKAAATQKMHRDDILEIGTYCGYSAIRMAMACPDAHIVTLEADPAHMIIARNMLAFAGLSDRVDVWTGHSKDLLHRLHLRYQSRQSVQFFQPTFTDKHGRRYVEDLTYLENETTKKELCLPGCPWVRLNAGPIWCLVKKANGTNSTEVATGREIQSAAQNEIDDSIWELWKLHMDLNGPR